jgi:hypothetical protein
MSKPYKYTFICNLKKTVEVTKIGEGCGKEWLILINFVYGTASLNGILINPLYI